MGRARRSAEPRPDRGAPPDRENGELLGGWWVQRRLEHAELEADFAAVRLVGGRPVAGALWALGGSSALAGTAAFAGATELPVARLPGDPVPSRRPGWRPWVASAGGLLLAFRVASVVVVALAGCS